MAINEIPALLLSDSKAEVCWLIKAEGSMKKYTCKLLFNYLLNLFVKLLFKTSKTGMWSFYTELILTLPTKSCRQDRLYYRVSEINVYCLSSVDMFLKLLLGL